MIEISVGLGVVSINESIRALASGESEEQAISGFINSALTDFPTAICAGVEDDTATRSEQLTAKIRLMAGFLSAYASTDPSREFEGQPHTMFGERGAQEISNVRMRDLSDCLLRSMAYCCWEQLDEETRNRVETDQYDYNEVFNLDLNRADPIAIMQNLVVEVEKVMGIYPNVPALHATED